jgi:competence protein ComEC
MRRHQRYKFRRTTLLTACYAAFIGGVGLAHLGYPGSTDWLWLLVALLFVFRHRTYITLCLVITLGLGLGLWRGAIFAGKLTVYQPLYSQKVTITANANEDAVYGKHSQITFDAKNAQLEDGTNLAGKISLSGFGLNAVYQGDEVQASGKLYPGFGARQGSMSFAKLNLIHHHPSIVADIRRKFAAGMQSALPEPLAPFAMGLLIGQRATLPDGIKQDLLMVGLTHIIAVSGYNLTIMLRASKGLFDRSSKRMSTALSFALIGVFLLLAGSSASITRAAIVSMLSIVAAYYGRCFKPLNLLLLAAAITAWVNPFYVWSDVSWYLSFLAFYGVMVLAPAMSQRVWPGRELPMVPMIALESVCAEAMTLPYVLYIFGQMSFVGLPANVLVTTLVPLAMLLSMAAGLGGMLAGPLAGWIAWPARWLLTYMLDIAHVLSRVPHAFSQNIGFTLSQMLAAYGIILLAFSGLQFKARRKSVTITDKKDNNSKDQKFERTFEMVNNQAPESG